MAARGRSALAIKRSKAADRPRERARKLEAEINFARVREDRAEYVIAYLVGVIQGLTDERDARGAHELARQRAAEVHSSPASVEEDDIPF